MSRSSALTLLCLASAACGDVDAPATLVVYDPPSTWFGDVVAADDNIIVSGLQLGADYIAYVSSYDRDGSLLWRYEQAPAAYADPLRLAHSSTGRIYAAQPFRATLAVLDDSGTLLAEWHMNDDLPGWDQTSIADIDIQGSDLVVLLLAAKDAQPHLLLARYDAQTLAFRGAESLTAMRSGQPARLSVASDGTLFVAATASFDPSPDHTSPFDIFNAIVWAIATDGSISWRRDMPGSVSVSISGNPQHLYWLGTNYGEPLMLELSLQDGGDVGYMYPPVFGSAVSATPESAAVVGSGGVTSAESMQLFSVVPAPLGGPPSNLAWTHVATFFGDTQVFSDYPMSIASLPNGDLAIVGIADQRDGGGRGVLIRTPQ